MNEEDIKPLTDAEINKKLKDFPGWNYHDNKISKELKFQDFIGSLSFINRLVPFCQAIDHHPDVHIYYSKVVFDLQRFSIGGQVTGRDFKVAGEIEKLYKIK